VCEVLQRTASKEDEGKETIIYSITRHRDDDNDDDDDDDGGHGDGTQTI
jgi:hypothetical protein